MTAYDIDYALRCLRDAIDYAEQTGDFVAARKWVNEVEKSADEIELDSEVARKLGAEVKLNSLKKINLKIEISKVLTFRLWLFTKLMRFAAWVGSTGIEFVDFEPSLIDPHTQLVDPPPGEDGAEGSP